MKKDNVVVNLPKNTDGSPVAMLVQVASRYESRIYITEDSRRVNAKSIMGMMALRLNSGTAVEVSAEGPDEEEAFAAVREYLLASGR